MDILVINAGSSSLKYQLISMEDRRVIAKGNCERIGIEGSKLKHEAQGKEPVVIARDMKNHSVAIKMVLEALLDKEHGAIESLSQISAVGHRVLHGGKYFSESVVVDSKVKAAIRECFELGPLHNPANLTGIEACEEAMPGVPQVAVFDTAFHQTMPEYAYMYGLPYEYYEKYTIRKYGFHGTSHRYITMRAAEMLKKPKEEVNLITVHLGNGSSIAAVKNGKCVDTTMGLTPLAGVVMGTRCGDIDPAIVPYIMDKEGLSTEEIRNLMNKRSGVLGISGVSSDFRDLEKAAAEGNKRAALALDMFVYTVKTRIGAYLAALNGADAVALAGGIGENSVNVRNRCVEGLDFLGIKIDPEKSGARGIEAEISAPDSKVKVLIVPTNEELMIALDTQRLTAKLV